MKRRAFLQNASLAALATPQTIASVATPDFVIHPNRPKQIIRGLGFEIQADSIGSGNHGLPEEPIAVPHDLVPSERERLADELLKGFRYCRLAGGLYWRGLDAEKKFMRPRWPEQLQELKQLLDRAGVEGLSFEYWSPAPFWKGNRAYYASSDSAADKASNVLRCFAPSFADDPDYKGHATRFLDDFAQAVVTDIRTLKAAGLKTSIFGLQNEPMVNHGIYPTCEYVTSEHYVRTYRAVAGAIRRYDPSIMLVADTEAGFPHKIGPAMNDPQVAALVDAYVVHTIGSSSENARQAHQEIRARLPLRPWFQNEYEYLTGGATPDRCLNTVQHIMNSFQLAENPTWFWIHCLKPLKNAEASGYALGFWKSLIEKNTAMSAEQFRRWPGGPEFTDLPEPFKRMEMVSATRPVAYRFIVNQPVTAYLLAENAAGPELDSAWEKLPLKAVWTGGSDTIFRRQFAAGEIAIPAPVTRNTQRPAIAHAVFVEPINAPSFSIQIGVNQPIQVRSQALALERTVAGIKPGHWIFNPLNWNAVGSFVKHMPWDCRALAVDEKAYDAEARILAFKKPNGKVTVVVSNRSNKPRSVAIATGLEQARWKGSRYTPYEAGPDTKGVPVGSQTGAQLNLQLAPQSWEFWEQQ